MQLDNEQMRYVGQFSILPVLDAIWANCRSQSRVTADELTLTLPINLSQHLTHVQK